METLMKQVKVEIEGIAPLKFDRFALGQKSCKTDEDYKKAAEDKVYRCDNGDIGLPTNAIKAVIRNASAELGKKMESRKNRQSIAAGVFFREPVVSLGKKKHDGIVIDIITRTMTRDKVTRMPTYRPLVKDWNISFEMSLIGVEPSFVRQALELGGLRYGLLGHRPEFGRFIVTKFEESK